MTVEKIGTFYVTLKKSSCIGCRGFIEKGKPYAEPWWEYGRIHLDCFEIVAARHRKQFEKDVIDIRSQIIQTKRVSE